MKRSDNIIIILYENFQLYIARSYMILYNYT